MRIKRFKYLNKERNSDFAISYIIEKEVLPIVGIAFDELVWSTIKSVPEKKLMNIPAWELYLNVLIQEYNISENTVEESVKSGICKLNEEIQKNVNKFYRLIK